VGPTSRGAYYAPEAFDSSVTWTEGFEGDRVPDIDAARHDDDRFALVVTRRSG
jgi:hypothetical protein